jgi:hypothetical protein
MKTVTCINETCPENGVQEHFCGDPEKVYCGVCRETCELSELYDDDESCNWTPGSNP